MLELEEYNSFIASMLYLKIEADRLNMPLVTRNLKLAILTATQEAYKHFDEDIEVLNIFF